MALDYATLERLRQNHPAWRLLCAHLAPLVAGFLHRVFIVPNVRNMSQADLVEALEDEIFALREQLGADAFPGTALGYLNDWAENDKGWLRKFYPAGTDEPHFDLTPSTEKALAWLENRRIMDILHRIEHHALALHEAIPAGDFMPLAETAATIELPLERPLYRPPIKPLIAGMALDEGDAEIDTAALYAQVVVDRTELIRHLRQELQERGQISLAEVVARHPLRHGLAELVVYLQLASEWPRTAVDDEVEEEVCWQTEDGVTRQATLPRIILLRS